MCETITYKSISILQPYSVQVDIRASEVLPYEAIHAEIPSPLTKRLDSLPFAKYTISTSLTKREKVL